MSHKFKKLHALKNLCVIIQTFGVYENVCDIFTWKESQHTLRSGYSLNELSLVDTVLHPLYSFMLKLPTNF